ncbi:MAG: neutral/alkaline non-lysosomal ceramidase N-terminal domain-containing protein, partial [Thermomicrobiales bacterium]
MTILRAGSAQADITPDWPLTMAGFAVRDHASEGVHHPLRVRAVVLESETPESTPARTVIVSADVLFWAAEFVDLFKDDICAIAHVLPGQILLSATHTHSGPQTSGELSSSIGVLDPRFHDRLRDGVRNAVTAAIDQLEPVTMSRWVGEHDLGFNRRPQFNPNGSVDRTLTVLRLDRDDGSPSTMLVHYACHPTIYQGYQLSSEYCGVAMNELEHR